MRAAAPVRELLHPLVWAERHRRGNLTPTELGPIARLLPAGATVFDVGAHSGSWSVTLAALGHRVVAFEALPYYARTLRRTIRLLGQRNVRVEEVAVADCAGTASLVDRDAQGKRLTGLTHLRSGSETVSKAIAVPTVRLDRYYLDEGLVPAFIKLDIEGAEPLALRGAVRILEDIAPVLLIEMWSSHLSRYGFSCSDIFDLLTPAGYRAFVVCSSTSLVEISSDAYPGEGDLVFINPRATPIPDR